MNLQANKATVIAVSKGLSQSWQEVKQSWRDTKQMEFERAYMETLQANLNIAVEAMEKLDKVLTKIRRDCE
jgi:hypothetical protein